MWDAAHHFERAAEAAAAERARRAVLNAIGYVEPAQRPPLPRLDEQLHNWFFHTGVPFITWVIKSFFSIIALLMLSIGTYAILWGLIMRGINVRSRSIFFDYSPGASMMPTGIVDLRSTHNAPWAHSCGEELVQSTAGGVCIKNDSIISAAEYDQDDIGSMNNRPTHERRILAKGQRHFFEVVLTLPESEINKQLGVFMVKVDLRSADRSLLASSKQHGMLPYESTLVSRFRKVMLILPLAFGLFSETRTVSFLCFDHYVDADDKNPMSLVEVSLEVPNLAVFPATLQTIQIHSATIRYGREMNSIQVFLHNWRYSCAFFGIVILFLGFALTALSIMKHRSQRNSLDAQPYADFFDSDDETADNSNSASQGRWMGADIEILEDDEDDNDAWEPIESKEEKEAKIGDDAAQKPARSNIVSDDESFFSKQKDTGNHQDVNFPPGTPANDTAVLGHGSLVGSKPHDKAGKQQVEDLHSKGNRCNYPRKTSSQEKEEQCLADMVMKGRSKWGVFTGAAIEEDR